MQIEQSEAPAPSGETRSSIFPIGQMLPFLLVVSIFFLWGMSNNLTDILVQQFKKSFNLSLLEAQLVQTAVFLAYGTMAIPAALLTRRFGYKAGVLIGLVVFGIGTLLFWPAAVIGQYAPFLVALFIVGCGSSTLEAAANPLIAQFGPAATSERRLNFAQAFNPPGSILGVLIGTFAIFSGIEKNPAEIAAMQAQGTYAEYLHGEILRVVPTYVGLGLCVLLLAGILVRVRFPASLDAAPGDDSHASLTSSTGSTGSRNSTGSFGRLLANPHLMFAVVTQFFYVGAQVSTWSTLIPYVRTYTAAGERTAGYLLTGTLLALAAGRIVSTSLMRYIPPDTMIAVYALINIALLAVSVLHPGMTGAYAIVATSFFMSVMYPTIFALGVKGLGSDTKIGGSLLVMAILGGAIFPPLMGGITRLSGSVALGYTLPAVGYVMVALYGFLASRLTPHNAATA